MEQFGFPESAQRAEGDPFVCDPFVQKLKPGGTADVQPVSSVFRIVLKCAVTLQICQLGAAVSGLCRQGVSDGIHHLPFHLVTGAAHRGTQRDQQITSLGSTLFEPQDRLRQNPG